MKNETVFGLPSCFLAVFKIKKNTRVEQKQSHFLSRDFALTKNETVFNPTLVGLKKLVSKK